MLRNAMHSAQVVSLIVCVGAGRLRLSAMEALPDAPSSIRAYMKIYKSAAILVKCLKTDKSPLVVHMSSCA
jgi:putative NADH-flavin reductase